MKKQIKYNYTQLLLLQELMDLNFDYLLKKNELQKRLEKADVGNWSVLLGKDLKIKKVYVSELLTEEENKLINFNNLEVIKKYNKKGGE
jgi:hypothetical protein